MSEQRRNIRQLRHGERFMWAGRVVTYLGAEKMLPRGRPSTRPRQRRLTVQEQDGTTRRLYYRENESVTLPCVREETGNDG